MHGKTSAVLARPVTGSWTYMDAGRQACTTCWPVSRLNPKQPNTARQLLAALVEQSRQEAGCVRYELYQQAATPHVFQTVEQWKDEAAAKAHMGTPHVGAAIAAARPLFAAPPEILAYTKLA